MPPRPPFFKLASYELSVMFPPVLRLELPAPPPLAAGDDNDGSGGGGGDIAGLPAHPQRVELLAAYPWLRYFRVMTAEPPPPLPVPITNPPPPYAPGDAAFVREDAHRAFGHLIDARGRGAFGMEEEGDGDG